MWLPKMEWIVSCILLVMIIWILTMVIKGPDIRFMTLLQKHRDEKGEISGCDCEWGLFRDRNVTLR